MKRILAIVRMNSRFQRQCLSGITAYAAMMPDWEVLIGRDVDATADDFSHYRTLDVVGAVAIANTQRALSAAETFECPTVYLSAEAPDTGRPRVGSDEAAIGRMAAEHFLELGFRSCAFLGLSTGWESIGRWRGFAQALAESGVEPLRLDYLPVWPPWAGLLEWVSAMPKPAGVFCTNDFVATWLLQACRVANLPTPESVAILGVDDDDIQCESCQPALSSIRQAGRQVGFAATQVLDQLINGSPPPSEPILFAPEELVVRRSTDIVAVEDADVSQALRFIRENAHRPIHVEDVLDHLSISRTALETKFSASVARTPYKEIRRMRAEWVKHLLRQTDLTIEEIAARGKFGDAAQLSHMFRDVTGTTPSRYRAEQRPAPGR